MADQYHATLLASAVRPLRLSSARHRRLDVQHAAGDVRVARRLVCEVHLPHVLHVGGALGGERAAIGELRTAVRVVRDLVVLHQRPDQAA